MPFGRSNNYGTNVSAAIMVLRVVSLKAFSRFPQGLGISSAAYIDVLEQIIKPEDEKEDLMCFAKTLQHHTVAK